MSSQIVTLSIDQGLARRHDSLLSVCAQGIYQRGLKKVALSIAHDPGNLTRELCSKGRHLSVESFERYLETSGDTRPIHYLIERFLLPQQPGAEEARKAAVLAQVQALMASLDR